MADKKVFLYSIHVNFVGFILYGKNHTAQLQGKSFKEKEHEYFSN